MPQTSDKTAALRLASRESLRKLRTLDDTKYDVVPTPEWRDAGIDAVRVRSLTSGEKDEYEDSTWVDSPKGNGPRVQSFKNARARIVRLGAVDADGASLFEAEDLIWLVQRNAAPLQRLWDKILELSNLDPTAAAKLGEDSGADRSAVSASGSPSPSAGQ